MTQATRTIESRIDEALAENTITTPQTRTAPVARDVDAYDLTGFSTRDVPWGKLGATLEGGAVTALEAAERGGMNFHVELLDAGFKTVTERGNDSWRKVPHRRACVREDTGAFLSYVSDTYRPIQYAEAFAFMDEISPNYVAAGTLGQGRVGFMVVQLPEHLHIDPKIKGRVDPHDLYVVLRTSHDLSRALEVSVLSLRGACMNAITLKSFAVGATHRWSVRHVGRDPLAKLNAARETLSHVDAYAHEYVELARRLAEVDLDLEAARSVLKKVLPDRPKREEQVNSILHAWKNPETNGFGTDGWGLTNAVNEYFEWGRDNNTRTAQSRFTGGLDGATHKFTNRTAQLLLRRG